MSGILRGGGFFGEVEDGWLNYNTANRNVIGYMSWGHASGGIVTTRPILYIGE